MTNTQRILIIDDDARLRELLLRYLTEQGFAAKAVADGSALDKALALNRYHLLVLDLMLPGEDGLAILRRLRGAGENVPVILLTAKGDEGYACGLFRNDCRRATGDLHGQIF